MKDALRAEARARLRALPPDARAAESAEVARRVWTVPEVAEARTLLLFASLADEVDTDDIAAEARRRGIAVVYPRCLAAGVMTLHEVTAEAVLRSGRFGIREPEAEACPVRAPGEIDAALVPGLAWDRAGRRLGRGAGYYDRLFADPAWRGFRCGLFFAASEFPALPADPWDVPLDAVVTGAEVVRVAPADLREALLDAWHSDAPHAERMTRAAAVIAYALGRSGMRATLVGGGALEFWAPGTYLTTDLDFVVEGGSRERMGEVLNELGMQRMGRHWVIDDLYVEVPGNHLTDPFESVAVGPYHLQVIGREVVLAERIVGFRYWKAWAYGLQAIRTLRAIRNEIDRTTLIENLESEGAGAVDAYLFLDEIAVSGQVVTAADLDRAWHLRYR